jgi:DNA-directed RNA polymerase specialized sigma24 family protein
LENQATFLEIYEKHKSLVFNVCLNYLQNQEDAEEVFQDVFLKVHDKIDKFEERSSLKTWIYRITINLCLDFIKAKKEKNVLLFFNLCPTKRYRLHLRLAILVYCWRTRNARKPFSKQSINFPKVKKRHCCLKVLKGCRKKKLLPL